MIYKRIFNLIFFVIFSFNFAFSQNSISGKVSDVNNIPIPNASVVLTALENDENIIAYCFTNAKGNYVLPEFEITTGNLKFAILGYKSKVISVTVKSPNLKPVINVILDEEITSLNEVIIESESPISITKDTIAFKTKFFKNGTEETVEDLLKKIPGLNIDTDGNIFVGNKPIEKLMVDGDDFFEKGYKILSKNMPAYPIEEVQVLKNFSENRLLKGIKKSDKVALNLKVDEKFKRVWFGNLETVVASINNYEAKSNLMNFGKSNKYYFLTNFNNVGYDASGDIQNLITPFRFDEISSSNIGDNQNANKFIQMASNDYLSFKKERSNFNDSKLVSLNAIFNPNKKLKIKTLGYLNLDKQEFFRNLESTTFFNDLNFTNNEQYKLNSNPSVVFGKLDINYSISSKKQLDVRTKYNINQSTNNSSLAFNNNFSSEGLKDKNHLFDQKINYNNRFSPQKVFLLTGRFIKEKTSQTYSIDNFVFNDLFPLVQDANNALQEVSNNMQFIGLNGHLLINKKNDNLLEFEIGNHYRKDRLVSSFALLKENETVLTPLDYQNFTSYNVNDLYLKGKYKHRFKNFSFSVNTEAHQLFNQIENSLITENQKPFFLNTDFNVNVLLSKKNSVSASYSTNTSNAKLSDIYNNYIATGFQSFSKGSNNLNQLASSNFLLGHKFGKYLDTFFVDTNLIYKRDNNFFSTNSIINQNFIQTQKITIEDRNYINLQSSLNYFNKYLSSNLRVDLGYSQNEFKNIINNSNFRYITSTDYNFGFVLKSGFKGFFNYRTGTKWIINQIETTVKNAFTNNVSFLNVSLALSKKLNLEMRSKQYFFGNLNSNKTYNFIDFDAKYAVIKNKLNLKLIGRNILNKKFFRNSTINDFGSTTIEYRLLPRFILLKLDYVF